MNKRPDTRQVPIFNSKTGETSFSKPMPVKKPYGSGEKPESSTFATEPESPTASRPTTNEVSARQVLDMAGDSLIAQTSSEAASGSSKPSGSNSGQSKSKPEIETLEQFIAHAYARKGQRLALKDKVVRSIANKCTLDEQSMRRLMQLTNADKLLVVPRQLLLVSLEVQGNPAMKGALQSFVKDMMMQHPVFADLGVQSAIQNLPEAVSPSEALATVGSYKPQDVESQDEVKVAALQVLCENAMYLLSTWFVCHRGLTIDALAKLLRDTMWIPAARELADDTARLRALTEVGQPASIGLVSQRLLSETAEASWARDRAETTSQSLRLQVSEIEGRFQEVCSSLEARTNELESLRKNSTEELVQQRKQTEAELMHLRHELEQLRGRLVRRLDDSVEMLEVGLNALRNKTPRIEVMLERAELVVDELRAEKNNLKEE
jgi:hypothetical protein